MKPSSRVCVVGAGAVGLSVALYLAEERLRSHPEVTTEIGELKLMLEQTKNLSPLILVVPSSFLITTFVLLISVSLISVFHLFQSQLSLRSPFTIRQHRLDRLVIGSRTKLMGRQVI